MEKGNKDILSKNLVNKLQKRVSTFNKEENNKKFTNLISNFDEKQSSSKESCESKFYNSGDTLVSSINVVELIKRKERKNKKRIDLFIDLTGNFKKIIEDGCTYICLSDVRVNMVDNLFYKLPIPIKISYEFLLERAFLKRRKRLLDSMLNKFQIILDTDSEEINSIDNLKI